MKKLTYEFVKGQFEKEGHRLSSKEYVNANTKLDVICDNGHDYSITYGHFYSGKRCPYCYGNKRHDYEFIKEQIEKEDGYELQSKEYINNRSDLDVRCNQGHIFQITWHEWDNGYRCSCCAGNKKHEYDFIKECFENENYKLLSNEYVNAISKLDTLCPIGHFWKTSYDNFRVGKRCYYCDKILQSERQKHDFEFIKSKFENENYKLSSKEYINNNVKLDVLCPVGHEIKIDYSHFKQGRRCPICDAMKTSSKPENEIQKYVKSLNLNTKIVENDRTQIKNPKTKRMLELDVWLPELKKAVEFNGIFWHSSEYSKYKDNQKIIQCKEKKIDLLVIEEQDYIDDKNKCLNKVKEFLKDGI